MPVSGNEEAGVKPFTWQQSSLDIAGVPIKKRRFIRLPSPPPEEQSSPPVLKDATLKEPGGQSEDLGSLGASKTESSLKMSDATGTLPPKEFEGTCADLVQLSGFGTVKVEELSVAGHSGSLVKLGKEPKLVAEKSADVLRSETAGLDLTPVKTTKVDPVKDLHDRQTEEGSQWDTLEAPGNPDLSLELEEHHVSDLEDRRCHANNGIHRSPDSISLKLSLSNEESLNQQNLEGVQFNTENVNVSANRSNWDLNTTMDKWEDKVANESKTISEIHDLKPSTCSAEFGEIGFAIKNQLLCETDCGSGMGSTITQLAQHSVRGDSLHLHHRPSVFSSNISQDPSSLSTMKDFPGVPSISLPLVLGGNANISNSRIVKSEPFDEGTRHDSRGVGAVQLLNSKAVKLECSERPSQKISRLSSSSTNERPGQVLPGLSSISPTERPGQEIVEDGRKPDDIEDGEKKINFSCDIVEEDCEESEYESDGNSLPMDIEDSRKCDDIEDGEFQEQGLDAAVEGHMSEVHGNLSHDCAHDNITCSAQLQVDYVCPSLHVEGTEHPCEDPATTNMHAVKQYVGGYLEEKRMDNACKDASVGESSTVGMLCSGAPEDHLIMASQGEFLGVLGEKDVHKGQGTDNQANSGGQESSVTVAQDSDENVKLNDSESDYSAMQKVEVPLGDDAIKDLNSGQRSRIINLSRTSGEATPGKTRSMASNTLTSYAVRERLPDGPLEGDRPYPRGRNETYSEGFHKFSRERYQDQRNYRMNFIRGRGRFSSRSDSFRADRSSECNFATEFNDCLSEYGVPRNKYVAAAAVAAAAVAEGDVKFTNHNVGPDDEFMGAGRGRRKVVDDEVDNFHRLPSRRRSPVGRDGPVARGVQMARRVPRSMNEDGTEIGLSRSEKFVRGISNDGGERAYSCKQPSYDGIDRHYVQGTRSFSSVQGRALPRFRSKSPIRSRSPGPWSSSKKRSPDAFDGPQDLPHRRSPIYRVDRTGSPDHLGFPVEMVSRRQGSPTFLSRSNDLRELDSGRDPVHRRSMVSNRCPTGQALIRNNRRFGIVNHRERTDGNELLCGPMHPGRFHGVGSGDVEERRRFRERRGLVRSFRPAFNGSDGENFHVGTEDRPLRFFRDDERQFHERVNLRERPFETGMKNRPVNQPRRLRGIEDQEGNYTEQSLYEENEDLSRLKRKRF